MRRRTTVLVCGCGGTVGKLRRHWGLYTRTAEGTDFRQRLHRNPRSFSCQLGGPGTGRSVVGTGVNDLCGRDSRANTLRRLRPGGTLHEPGPPSTLHRHHRRPRPAHRLGRRGTLLDGGYVPGTVTAGVTAPPTRPASARCRSASTARVLGTSAGPRAATSPAARRAPSRARGFCSTRATSPTGVHRPGRRPRRGRTRLRGQQAVTVDDAAPSARAASPASLTTAAPAPRLDRPAGPVAPITARTWPSADRGARPRPSPRAGGGDRPGPGSAPTRRPWRSGRRGEPRPGHAATWAITFAPGSTSRRCGAPTGPAPVPPRRRPKTSPRLTVARARRPRPPHDRRAGQPRRRERPRHRTATARIAGRTRTVTRRATLRNRRYAIRVPLPSSAWRTATVTVRFAGDATHHPARVVRRVSRRQR